MRCAHTLARHGRPSFITHKLLSAKAKTGSIKMASSVDKISTPPRYEFSPWLSTCATVCVSFQVGFCAFYVSYTPSSHAHFH